MTISLLRPGMRSCFPEMLGIQNEWITSADLRITRTGTPAGKCSSFDVRSVCEAWGLEYRTSHHHWCPVISTVRPVDAARFMLRSTSQLPIDNPASDTLITPTQTMKAVRTAG